MRIVDLRQNTPEWLSYRRGKIMASDSPIIMSLSSFCSPKELYKQKKNPSYKSFETEPMRRGKLLEDDGRKFAESELKMSFPPLVVEHDLFHEYAASLDGINEENKCLLEIKVPGDKIFKDAILGKCPEYWIAQIQHQLYVTGYDLCYLCIYDGFDGKIVEIPRDPDFIQKMLSITKEWWSYFQRDEALPIEENDYVPVEIDSEQADIIYKWTVTKSELKSAQEHEKKYSEEGLRLLSKNLKLYVWQKGSPKMTLNHFEKNKLASINYEKLNE